MSLAIGRRPKDYCIVVAPIWQINSTTLFHHNSLIRATKKVYSCESVLIKSKRQSFNATPLMICSSVDEMLDECVHGLGKFTSDELMSRTLELNEMKLTSQLRQMEALKASLSAADEQVGSFRKCHILNS